MARTLTDSDSGGGFERYIAEMASRNFLKKEEEREHIRLAHAGNQAAVNRLVRSNALFILKYCEPFRYRGRMCGMSQSDLFSLAAIGFVRGIRAFTFDHDNRLNTYAGYWMWSELGRGLGDVGLTIRLPLKVQLARSRARKFMARFQTTHGCYPTDEQLAEGIGASSPQAAAALLDQPTAQSYDVPMRPLGYEEEEMYLLDAYVDPEAEQTSPLGRLLKAHTTAKLEEAMSRLTQVQREVLICRFVDDITLEEAAVELHKRGKKLVTRERIRQIQNAALERLRLFLKE